MNQLLSFWYGQSLGWVFTRFLHTVAILDGHLALRATAHNLTKPLFQDYTYQGKIIGFFLRIARIFFALLIYFFTFILYLAFYIIWLAFPVLCVASLIGSFTASSGGL